MCKVHCGSALGPGASGLPYYCAPLVCIPAVLGVLAVWQHINPNTKNQKLQWQSKHWETGTRPTKGAAEGAGNRVKTRGLALPSGNLPACGRVWSAEQLVICLPKFC